MATVVVVDDEPEWVQLCAERLQMMGHSVTSLFDSQEALMLLKKEKPDLVVMDIAMPISGRTLLRMLRDRSPEVPVVIYSGYGGYSDDPDFSQADGFVLKSTDTAELGKVVDEVLGGSLFNGGFS